MDLMENCNLCPRMCGVNRSIGQRGFCRMTDKLMVARAALHFWEEPCISGENGSGTVFFSGCTLKCVYCQNKEISSGESGKEITVERLSDIFIELQQQGANNINLVTPTHFIPQIIKAIDLARAKGLKLPIVYNSSGYERVEILKLLYGYVDIYLPDLKYYNGEDGLKYSSAKDYFAYASKAIEEMVRQTGEPKFSKDGIMHKGTIIRHLVLPEHYNEAKRIVKHIYQNYGDKVFLSLMSQYTPFGEINSFPELSTKIDMDEYDKILDFAEELGVENGFIQEGEAADESFIPPFDNEGV